MDEDEFVNLDLVKKELNNSKVDVKDVNNIDQPRIFTIKSGMAYSKNQNEHEDIFDLASGFYIKQENEDYVDSYMKLIELKEIIDQRVEKARGEFHG